MISYPNPRIDYFYYMRLEEQDKEAIELKKKMNSILEELKGKSNRKTTGKFNFDFRYVEVWDS